MTSAGVLVAVAVLVGSGALVDRPDTAQANTPAPKRAVVIHGVVRDGANGTSVPATTLRALISGTSVTAAGSDEQGAYRLTVSVPDSTVRVVVTTDRLGYRSDSVALVVRPDGPDSIAQDFALSSVALTLSATRTTGTVEAIYPQLWMDRKDRTLSAHFDSVRVETNYGAWSNNKTVRTTLYPDGRAIRDTVNLLHAPVLSAGQVDLRDYNRLAAMFDQLDFARLGNSYQAGMSDMGTVTLIVTRDGVPKSVEDYGDNGPIELWEMEQAVAEVVARIRWRSP